MTGISSSPAAAVGILGKGRPAHEQTRTKIQCTLDIIEDCEKHVGVPLENRGIAVAPIGVAPSGG